MLLLDCFVIFRYSFTLTVKCDILFTRNHQSWPTIFINSAQLWRQRPFLSFPQKIYITQFLAQIFISFALSALPSYNLLPTAGFRIWANNVFLALVPTVSKYPSALKLGCRLRTEFIKRLRYLRIRSFGNLEVRIQTNLCLWERHVWYRGKQ